MTPGTQPEVLITGASGLVGSSLMDLLGARAVGTYQTQPRPALVKLDVTDDSSVRRLLESARPRAVVHCAAWTHVDGCEQDPARSRAVNVDGVAHVSEAAAKIGARLVVISTDYVFGGDTGPHRVDEQPAPMNVYGRHKVEAERIVRTTAPDHAIVRSCNVYGYLEGGKNFVMAVRDCALSGRKLRSASDQWGNPTLAAELAGAIVKLADSTLRGTFHVAGPDYVDRPTWAALAAEAFGVDPGFLEFVPTDALRQPARRPLRAGLDSSDSCARLGVRLSGVRDGVRLVAQQAARARRERR